MNDAGFAGRYLDDLGALLAQLDREKIARAIQWMRETGAAGRTIYTCGNGGSASIASQFVVDVVKGATMCSGTRYRMIALTDSVATITAYANDVSYESVFVEPLKNFAREGDVLVAISGSGESANVIAAVEYANAAGVRTIGLTNASSGRLREICRLSIEVPDTHMGRLEDCFFIITHILCYRLMDERA